MITFPLLQKKLMRHNQRDKLLMNIFIKIIKFGYLIMKILFNYEYKLE